ncbi:MAG: discoidin domain-containing protein, partial [Phycisphaeraceae bacterium]
RTQRDSEWVFLAEVAVNATVPGPTWRHAALGKPVTLANPPQTKQALFTYAAHGPPAFLTDGYQSGVPDWQTPEWLGFDKDLDATIDLGAVIDLHEVSATFMQHAYSRVRIPQTMQIHVSDDGKAFNKVATVAHEPSNAGEMIKTLSAKLDGAKGRHVRVVAPNQGGWLFVDEIVVNPQQDDK